MRLFSPWLHFFAQNFAACFPILSGLKTNASRPLPIIHRRRPKKHRPLTREFGLPTRRYGLHTRRYGLLASLSGLLTRRDGLFVKLPGLLPIATGLLSIVLGLLPFNICPPDNEQWTPHSCGGDATRVRWVLTGKEGIGFRNAPK